MLPVKETKKLRGAWRSWKNTILEPGENPLSELSGELLEIQSEIELGSASEVGFTLRGNPLLYNVQNKTLTCKDETVEVEPGDGKIRLHIFVDRTTIEIFGNEGRMPIFLCFPLDTENKSLEVFARGGQANIQRLKVWKLKSIWA
jgi:sucrose-6-phosphate hydrolase SacC (GH32 family)